MDQSEKKGENSFRPKARLIKTIGEELISSNTVALIELVKNSYDADATSVKIIFEGDIEKGQGKIIIEDNGRGMDLPIIKHGWMEPATSAKKEKNITENGRRVLGEKGIGRFASARLSKKLKIITLASGNKEIIASFDWGDFNNDKKYLDEVKISWEASDHGEIKDHGTKIILEDLNSNWGEKEIGELHVALSRLINPLSPVNDFEISLILPEKFKKYSGSVTPPDIIDVPHYKISGSVDKDGKINMIYSSLKKKDEQIEENLEINGLRPPICGPFSFEFRVWDRDTDSLKLTASQIGHPNLKDIKRDLNEAAGVSIYRDGFRVLPYGERKNDWLRLDIRRVQNPTTRVSNNQIVGYVTISMDKNPDLKDQSNREGIIESPAFDDFRETIKEILKKLEERRYKERRPKDAEELNKSSIFADISISPVIEMVKNRLPNDAEATLILIQTDEKIKEGIRKIQEVLSRYRRLSTLGLIIDTVMHDGNLYLSKSNNQILLLEKYLRGKGWIDEEITKMFTKVKKEREGLSSLFRRLEPFGGRRPKISREFILEESIKNVFDLFSGELRRINAEISIPESRTLVKVNEQDFQTIIVNLLQNSIYWLERKKEGVRKIEIEVFKDDDLLSILFSDSGPGIKSEDAPYIFDPYFTTKADGIGLGLTISGELVTEYGGILELVKNPSLGGASFKIQFKIQDGSKNTGS
jgi:signal transduction histidine kinase